MSLFTVAMCLCSLVWGEVHQSSLVGTPGVRWQTLETAHFRVTFPAGLAGLAQEAAIAIERARASLRQDLGYVPPHKIDLVLHDSTDIGEIAVDTLNQKIVLSIAQAECASRAVSVLQEAISRSYTYLVETGSRSGLSGILRPWLHLWHEFTAPVAQIPILPCSSKSKQEIDSPDGRQTIFIRRDWYRHFYFYGDLYLYDSHIGSEERLTEGARIYRAHFFPDGKRILLAQYRWGDDGPILSVLDVQSKQIVPFKEFPLHDYFPHSLAISPTGQEIALSLWRRGGFQDIYLLPFNLEANDRLPLLKQITRDRALDLNPVFSSDGHFVRFDRSDTEGSPHTSYAYRLADGAFFRITGREDSDPENWEVVQLDKEPFPSWEGFPETDYPVLPYDPRATMEPKLWMPLLSLASVGLATLGEDALRRHSYQFSFSFDWEKLRPAYWLRYEDRQFLIGFSALIKKNDEGSQQKVTATLPLLRSLRIYQQLSLFYHREEQELAAHTIGLAWHGALSMGEGQMESQTPWRHRLEFSLIAQTRTRTGQRMWENQLYFELQETLYLSSTHELRVRWRSEDSRWHMRYSFPVSKRLRSGIFASWSPEFSWGLELEPAAHEHWTPRLGIVWNAAGEARIYLQFFED